MGGCSARGCPERQVAQPLPIVNLGQTRVAPEQAALEARVPCSAADAAPAYLLTVPARSLRGDALSVRQNEAVGKSNKQGPSPPATSSSRIREDSAKVDALLRLAQPEQRLGALSDFAKAFCTESICLRLLCKYDGDFERSAAKLETVLRWRERNEELLTSQNFQEASDLRVVGFDLQGHPVLYQCARNQLLPNSKGLDQYVVRMLQAIDMMPPGVSTMTHVWDMHGMRLMMNLNPRAVLQLLNVLEGYFVERMHELLVVDAPQAAHFLVEAIWPMVSERTRKKVFFLSAKDALSHLQKTCASPFAMQMGALVELNRNPSCTLEERRRGWTQVDSAEIPVVAL
uniref:CRAL-TRIO domain-containing protein n=1 Tax=Alexandrium andersonii TaxID=327968 RepID=A0A7S2NIF9_9DINO|mmetsp:Transcript_96720/g.216692  ORF Transcript_96720/g.216692 Transcript_96720/m.216692 type:complete len:343 (+) Transcript_96720:56-1084(+)